MKKNTYKHHLSNFKNQTNMKKTRSLIYNIILIKFSTLLSVRPAQILIWTNPNWRREHANTTMGESSGSQGPVFSVFGGYGVSVGDCQ